MNRTNMGIPRPAPNTSFAGLRQFNVKTIQKCLNAENQPKVSRVMRDRDPMTYIFFFYFFFFNSFLLWLTSDTTGFHESPQ